MILCFRFAARVWIWHCSRKISIWSNGLAPMHIAHRIIHIRKNRCSLLMSMASWSSMNVLALTLSRCNQNDCGHTKKNESILNLIFDRNYTPALLEKHKSSIEQLIHRDKNHACVVMWSIANEPRTQQHNADSYFGYVMLFDYLLIISAILILIEWISRFSAVANFTKSLDPNRPITAAIAVSVYDDKAVWMIENIVICRVRQQNTLILQAKHLDIISFNRYNGWYSNPGKLDMITSRVIDEAIAWNTKHDKPVLMSEYGADTVEGLHFVS